MSCERGRTGGRTNELYRDIREAGLHAGVCDRRVDEEQKWQLVSEITVNSTAKNLKTV